MKALSKGILSREVAEQLEAVPGSLATINDVYESKAHLDAVSVDIRSELETPIRMPEGAKPAPEPQGDDLEKWHLISMATEVPTLKDLRALPVARQAQLLLRRLATQSPRSDMSVGRMNLDIDVHARDLASGYPDNEVTAVKNLLLAAPWKSSNQTGSFETTGRLFSCDSRGIRGGETI